MRIFRPRLETLSDAELCGKIHGDRAAFDMLYDRYSQRVFQYLLRMLNNRREQAEDLLQEVFVQVFEHHDRFDGKRSFSTWIFAIAHHRICNEYRAHEVRDRSTGQSPPSLCAPSAEAAVDNEVFRVSLLKALDAIDEKKRSAFLLRFQEGFPLAAIAQIQDCAIGTVKSRLFYTCRLLADQLRDFDPHYHEEQNQ